MLLRSLCISLFLCIPLLVTARDRQQTGTMAKTCTPEVGSIIYLDGPGGQRPGAGAQVNVANGHNREFHGYHD